MRPCPRNALSRRGRFQVHTTRFCSAGPGCRPSGVYCSPLWNPFASSGWTRPDVGAPESGSRSSEVEAINSLRAWWADDSDATVWADCIGSRTVVCGCSRSDCHSWVLPALAPSQYSTPACAEWRRLCNFLRVRRSVAKKSNVPIKMVDGRYLRSGKVVWNGC